MPSKSNVANEADLANKATKAIVADEVDCADLVTEANKADRVHAANEANVDQCQQGKCQ
jgi:hypothetical protein